MTSYNICTLPVKKVGQEDIFLHTTSRLQVNPDSFDKEVIRHAVHSFYKQRRVPPTLTN